MGEAPDKLDPRPEHLERQIERTRARLDEKLGVIEARTRRALSLRHYVEQAPWKTVGGVLAAGFVLGVLRKPHHHRRDDDD